MASVLGCNLKVSEFKLLSSFYIHFRTNTLREGMNLFIPAAMD